jgi:hypothetical protein
MSSTQNLFTIQFWGVRGSIACPGPETVRYGGNTPCIEMRVGGKRLIFDGGTGLRVLGQSMLSQMPVEAHMFLPTPTGIIFREFLSLYLLLSRVIAFISMAHPHPMEQRLRSVSRIRCFTLIFPFPYESCRPI